MNKKVHVLICFMLILITTSTLCFDEPNDPPEPPEEWWDLERFNTFLDENFTITEKKDSGSKMIQKIQNPDSTLYIAVGIDKEFSSLETEALYNLVSDGGNIIIASDLASTVNPLASKFGVSFSEHSIIYKFEEIDYNYTFLPVIASTQNNSFSIIVHSPLGLVIPSEDTRILAQSKGNGQIISALDKNDNIKIDGADKPGPIPIIVEVTVNSGKAVFISDAGMFSDNLWKLESLDPDFAGMIYQNEEFIVDLVSSMYTPDGKLIYDTSKQKEGFSNFHPYPEE